MKKNEGAQPVGHGADTDRAGDNATGLGDFDWPTPIWRRQFWRDSWRFNEG